jgi:hypothetical protein
MSADAINWSTVSAAIAAWVMIGSGLDASHVFWAYENRPRPTAPYIVMSIQQVRGIGHDWSTSAANIITVADVVTAVSGSSLTIPNHGLHNGDGPVQLGTTGALPAPLALDTNYWVIYVDANTIKLAASYVDTGGQQPLGAGNPVTPITLTSSGTGTQSVVSTDETVPAGAEVARTAQGFREVTVHLECIAADNKGYDAVRIQTNVVAQLQLSLYDLDVAGVGVSDLASAFSQGGIQHLEGHRGGILEPRAMFDLTFYLASVLTGFDTIIETISGDINITREDGTTHLPAIPFQIPPD